MSLDKLIVAAKRIDAEKRPTHLTATAVTALGFATLDAIPDLESLIARHEALKAAAWERIEAGHHEWCPAVGSPGITLGGKHVCECGHDELVQAYKELEALAEDK